jgi:hypothetical protein
VTPGQPTHLAALVRWYLSEVAAEGPQRIHQRSLNEMGAPEWHGSFRAWLLARAFVTDEHGEVRFPVAFWLRIWAGEGRESRVGADFLYRLGCLDGDWLAAVRTFTPLTEDGEVMARIFATSVLQRFWRQMQTVPHKFVKPPRSEAQQNAEEAA